MSIFSDVSAALAALINTDVTTAGFILGFTVIIVLVVALSWLLADSMRGNGVGFMMPMGVGIVFVVLVGWWPPWTMVFIGLVLVFIVFNPFGQSSGGGV